MQNHQEDWLTIAGALENYYFKGIYEGDVTLLERVIYPGTLLFGDVKGTPYKKSLYTYLEGVRNRKSPKDAGNAFCGTIRSIEVINSIALAKVNVKMYDFDFDEFLSFHKIDGKWMIVNKMITDTAP